MSEVILSVKPFYSDKIFNGDKVVELRKKIGIRFIVGARIFIYSSSPVMEITGHAEISQVDQLAISEIRSRFLGDACIAEEDFNDYYKNSERGFVIHLCKVNRFVRGVSLARLRSRGFIPPQSFSYPSERVLNLIESWL